MATGAYCRSEKQNGVPRSHMSQNRWTESWQTRRDVRSFNEAWYASHVPSTLLNLLFGVRDLEAKLCAFGMCKAAIYYSSISHGQQQLQRDTQAQGT